MCFDCLSLLFTGGTKLEACPFSLYWRIFVSMKISLLFCVIFFCLSTGCTHQPDLRGFDNLRWKKDKGGCAGERKTLLPAFKALRDDLKGTSSNDFATLFGKPDINQLTDRNQEYYIYFLEAGSHCQDITRPSNAPSVAIRFSAIGLATEITFQNGQP